MPYSAATSMPSRNGKKASEAITEPATARLLVGRLHRGDASGVDAAHLSRADADGGALAREHDRVRFDELADAPGEQQIRQLGSGRLAARDHRQLGGAHHAACRGSGRAARRSRCDIPARRRALRAGRPARARARSACVPAPSALPAEIAGAASTSTNWRSTIAPGGDRIQLAVERDDAAERGRGVGAVGAVIGLERQRPLRRLRRDWRA